MAVKVADAKVPDDPLNLARPVYITFYYKTYTRTQTAMHVPLCYKLIPEGVEAKPTLELPRGEAWDLYQALATYFVKEIIERAKTTPITIPQKSPMERELEAELKATKAHLLDLQRLIGLATLPEIKIEWNGEDLQERMDQVLKEAKESVTVGVGKDAPKEATQDRAARVPRGAKDGL